MNGSPPSSRRDGANRKNRSRRLIAARAVFSLHALVGLKLSFVLMLVLISGTLCVFNDEIDWLIYPQMRLQEAAFSSGQQPANFDAILAAGVAERPDMTIRSLEAPDQQQARAAKLVAEDADGHIWHVWINPYDYSYQGTTPRMTPGYFLYRLHFTLFAPFGRHLVNLFGPLLLCSLITGLLTYKKFWRGFFRLPRRGNTRRFLGDMHRLTALWSLWFLALLSCTGMWWFYNETIAELTPAPTLYEQDSFHPPRMGAHELGAIAGQGTEARWRLPTSLNAMVTLAEREIPQMQVKAIYLPRVAEYPLRITGTRGEVLIHENANSVYFDPASAQVLDSYSSAQWTIMQRVNRAMVPLHYGSWAKNSAEHGNWDLAVKSVWFLFGSAISFLAISGFLLFARRTKKQVEKLTYAAGITGASPMHTASAVPTQPKEAGVETTIVNQAMGRMRYVNWIILALCAIGAAALIVSELGLPSEGGDRSNALSAVATEAFNA